MTGVLARPHAKAAPSMHEAMVVNGTHVSQLRYEYSSDALSWLREQASMPDRLKTAVLRRRVDFLAGRYCAQRALQAAGFAGDAEIAIGERGQPLWPPSFVGSISHSDGFAIACVGGTADIAAIGIDIEQEISAEVTSAIGGQVATDDEMALGPRHGISAESWLTLLFSGKESLFKALYPSVGTYFDFLEASVTQLDVHAAVFTLRLNVRLSPQHESGSTYAIHFRQEGNHVITQCILPAPAGPIAGNPDA